MAATKKYDPAQDYEKKLGRVMERFGAQEWDWNWDRHSSWVKFKYKGDWYQFDYTIDTARSKGKNLSFGSDCFAKIVLTLERLALMVEDGIYDLQRWVKDMKALPAAIELPSFLKFLGFVDIPKSEDEIKAKYKEMAMIMHPDKGGDREDFMKLQQAYEKSLTYIGKKEG
jgi:hypothetical protein